MRWFLRMLFRGLTLPRCAASIFCGVLLGCLPLGSPVWLLVVLVITLTRTHIPAVLLAWCAGSVIAWPLSAWYAGAGAAVLQAHTTLWSAVAQMPVLCYFSVDRARVMGSLVCGMAAGGVVVLMSLSLWLVWRLRHPVRTEAA